jgi:hypothetical protein
MEYLIAFLVLAPPLVSCCWFSTSLVTNADHLANPVLVEAVHVINKERLTNKERK